MTFGATFVNVISLVAPLVAKLVPSESPGILSSEFFAISVHAERSLVQPLHLVIKVPSASSLSGIELGCYGPPQLWAGGA